VFRFAVTHVPGLFCNESAKYAERLRLWRAQGVSQQSSALRLCRPSLRSPSTALRVGDTPPLALAASAGVGQGQGVFVSKHSTAIHNGGTTHEPHHQHRHADQRKP